MAVNLEDFKQKAYAMFKADPLMWGKIFFAHHFRMESPRFHQEVINAAMETKKLSVAAPRESAKSTMLIFIYPSHGIIFKRFHFIVLVSNTFKKAAMHLDSIKKELAENQMLRETFPGIKIIRDAEGDSEFQHPDGFSVKFLCKGVDQIGSIRGVKYGAYRPDLILVDDMEDDELVKNPERRRDLQEVYDEALIPAGERGVVQIINVGTILHDDCQMAKLISRNHYPEFKKMIYRAHLDIGKPTERSLWPQKWSVEDLHKLMKEKPNVYAKEMQNDPVAGLNVRFAKADFRYWRQEGADAVLLDINLQPVSKIPLKSCKAAVSCDLAWSEKKDADYCVLLPGLLTPESDILISDYVARKGIRPDDFVEQLFIMVERLERATGSHVPVGFEKSMLENVTQFLLKREMKKRGKFLVTKELVWDNDKQKRIEIRLQPRYAQHVIFHKQGMGDLEHQLERFPSGAHDDIIDAEQGLVQLLQNPKYEEVPQTSESEFDRVRQIMINAKSASKPKEQKRTQGGLIRKRGGWFEIPANHAFR